MNRAWIVCSTLAVAVHALLIVGIRPALLAEPRPLGDEPSAVEISVVESAPLAPAEVPLPEVTPPEPAPPIAEAEPEPPEPEPELVEMAPVPKAPLPPRPAPIPPKTRTPASSRSTPKLTEFRGTASSNPSTQARSQGPTTSARPRYRSNPKPQYPAEARRLGQQGAVMITVDVSPDGRARAVQLSRSSGFPLLDAAALQTVRRWTFEPARAAGIPIACRVEVPVRFDLRR